MSAMTEDKRAPEGVLVDDNVIDDTRFRVVFLKVFKRGVRIAQVRERLRRRFNLSEEGVDRMFAHDSFVVKQNVDADVAYRYKQAIDETGANSKIEVMPSPKRVECGEPE
jgi:hypothetical protein